MFNFCDYVKLSDYSRTTSLRWAVCGIVEKRINSRLDADNFFKFSHHAVAHNPYANCYSGVAFNTVFAAIAMQ